MFEMMPVEGGGWTETVLHNFGNGTDGMMPTASLVFDAGGNLYGTTTAGGTFGGGTLFVNPRWGRLDERSLPYCGRAEQLIHTAERSMNAPLRCEVAGDIEDQLR